MMRDYDHACSLAVEHNSTTYDQDSSDEMLEEAKVNDLFSLLLPALNVDVVNRVGFRRFYLIPTDMSFDELVKVLNVKFLSQNERLRGFMPGHTDDLLYRVDSSDETDHFHFHVGPLNKSEIPRYIQVDPDNHLAPETRSTQLELIRARYSETSMLVDIDMFRSRDVIGVSEAAGFYAHGRKRISELTAKLTEYTFET
jgi:hypothetical protein